ncbi:MAG: hypothetical protein PVI78_02745 [Anaerolineales bacterium]|jgi:hypothetical protein
MKTLLTGCARTLAVIFVILFVIISLVVLLIFNVERELFDPEIYKTALAEEEFYERLPRLLAQQVREGMTFNPCLEDPSQCEGEGPPEPGGEGEGGPPAFFADLTEQDWEQLMVGLIPRPWLRDQLESAIDQIFVMLDSGDMNTPILLSMVELKTHIMGDAGVAAVVDLIQTRPPCTNEQLMRISQLEVNMSSVSMLLTCRPPQNLLDNYLPQIRQILGEVVGEIDDELDLTASFEGDGEGSGGFNLGTIRLVRLGIRLSPLLSVGLLLLVTLFGVRSLKGFFLWWGIPLLIVGLIAIGGSLLVPLLLNWSLSTYGIELMPGGISPQIIDFAFDIVRALFGTLAKAIALQATILAIVGLVFTIVSFFFKRSKAAVAVPSPQISPEDQTPG